ncbi:MAG: hypothetical protein ACXAEF_01290 [Candidatus Thorarchaeota archaeon]|jgi:hypothetical protein
MDRRDVGTNLVNVENLFNNGKYDEAIELLQECINSSRLESKEFMESLRDSTKDQEILDKLQYMYFMNFV